MEGAFDLGDELFGATTEHQGAGLGSGAVREDVEAVGADLAFFEEATFAEVGGVDIGAGRLRRGTCGLTDAFQVVGRDAASAEDVAVGEILGRQVTNGEFGEYHFGAGFVEGFHFIVDDLPLRVHNGLVLGHLLNPHFGVVFLRFEFEFNVEADDFGVLERLWLLFKTGV